MHYQINIGKKHNTLKNLKRSGARRKTKPFNDRVLLREFEKHHLLNLQNAQNLLNLTPKTPISRRIFRLRLEEKIWNI